MIRVIPISIFFRYFEVLYQLLFCRTEFFLKHDYRFYKLTVNLEFMYLFQKC